MAVCEYVNEPASPIGEKSGIRIRQGEFPAWWEGHKVEHGAQVHWE